MIGGSRLSRNDIKLLLHLYNKGPTNINNIVKKVLKHPERTYRVVRRLLLKGLIADKYENVKTPSGTGMWLQRVIYLTEEGKDMLRRCC